MYYLQDLCDLQDLYGLPERNLSDLYDLYILARMGSVRSAGSIFMICMISVECEYPNIFFHHVQPGWRLHEVDI